MSPEITLGPPGCFAALAERWRALEQHAPPGIFRTWLWAGCLAEERFAGGALLEAQLGGETVALALFGRHQRALWLNQTGDPSWDSVFTEQNGLLLHAAAPPGLAEACYAAALRAGRLVLPGLPLAALPSRAALRLTALRDAPLIDLAAAGPDYLAGRSANTRQQLRRSLRGFQALGPVRLRRAEGAAERLDALAALATLHQRSWQARGKPGAFAEPRFRRFHEALLATPEADGAVDLLHVTAGPATLGYLYNLCHRGHVSAYQSGFDYALAEGACRPGLTCHHLAIEHYIAAGALSYDFLGGADRYKRSLATGSTTLAWAEAAPRWSMAGLRLRALNAAAALRGTKVDPHRAPGRANAPKVNDTGANAA